MEAARKNPAAALLLSIVPGAGHVYAGRTGGGLAWLVGVFFAYSLFWGLGFLAHLVCAVSAAQAVAAANREEATELASRRESAEEVANILDRAASALPPSPAAPAPRPADPPPRIMRAAFPVPPDRLIEGLAGGMAEGGLLVLGVDREHHRVRASIDHGEGRFTTIIPQVEATPAGSRARLMIDRPAGSDGGAEIDDRVLRSILERTERSLAAPSAAVAGSGSPAAGAGEALTEDHFLEQLREAWESYEQGWLPEGEWLERKQSLIRSVTLRPGTRAGDVMTACRPLAEAGVLDHGDLRALEATLGGSR